MISTERCLDFDDVAIVPQSSDIISRGDVSVISRFFLRRSNTRIEGIPIIVSNLDATGNLDMASSMSKLGAFTCLSKYVDMDSACEFIHLSGSMNNTFVTVGPNDITDSIESLGNIVGRNQHLEKMSICLDAANGYSVGFTRALHLLRKSFPRAWIMAGNVCTGDGFSALQDEGADIVKIGIGSGQLCTTRAVTGVGIPQITAIEECSKKSDDMIGALLCADGGIRGSGDAAKAFAAGADLVMCGSYFSDTHEAKLIDEEDLMGARGGYAYGSASQLSRDLHGKGGNDYSTAEGVSKYVVDKYSAEDKLNTMLGGLRSTCAYVGALRISDLKREAQLVRIR